MRRVEAHHILGKMMNDCTVEQNEALTIALYDIEFVDLMPDDMVHVVRCKDCKHWTCFMNNPDGTLFGNCECHRNDFRNEGDFCSYGERKDGEG